MASTSTRNASPPLQKKITLTSCDGLRVFEEEENVAFQSETLKTVMGTYDDDNDTVSANHDNKIKFPLKNNITGEVLAHVVQYCKQHADYNKTHQNHTVEEEQELEKWDQNFIRPFKLDTVFDIMLAANYLEIRSLMDLSSQRVADLMKDLSVEQVREIFDIINDFTPEEQEALQKDNQWGFE